MDGLAGLGGRMESQRVLKRFHEPRVKRPNATGPLARLAVVLVVLGASLLAPSMAGALSIRSEFFGIVHGSNLDNTDLNGIKAVHVHTVRFLFPWESVQPDAGTSFAWTGEDKFIGRLASHGIRAVPTIWGNPAWVQGYTARMPIDRAQDLQAWQTFLKALVGRYGPNGYYWTHGYRDTYGVSATPLPITSWQIWNEPNLKKYDVPYPVPKDYGKLLIASHTAIRSVDPKAQVLLGGMPANAPSNAGVSAVDFLNQLYNKVPGVKNDFEAAALHPYAPTTTAVQNAITKFRTVMKNHADATTPLWISEIAWGSAPPDSRGINKGLNGQAQMLRDVYKLILSHRDAWNVQRLFWYHWRDPRNSQASCTFCSSAGLLRFDRTKKPAYTAFRGFTAETTAPKASITSGPAQGSTIHDPTPTFKFSSNEPGSTFQCRIDNGALKLCKSPLTTATLSNGLHHFNVRAIDAPGNVGTFVSRSFTVAP